MCLNFLYLILPTLLELQCNKVTTYIKYGEFAVLVFAHTHTRVILKLLQFSMFRSNAFADGDYVRVSQQEFVTIPPNFQTVGTSLSLPASD